MRLLLDENLPKRLKLDFPNHEIYTAVDKKWTGITNGKLVHLLLEKEFDALLTFDKNLQYQQNFSKYTIAVIILNAPDNTYLTLKSLVPEIKNLLAKGLKAGPTEVK